MHGGNGKVAYIDTEGTLYPLNSLVIPIADLLNEFIYIPAFLETVPLMELSVGLNALCQLLRDLGWMPMLFLTMYGFFYISLNPFKEE